MIHRTTGEGGGYLFNYLFISLTTFIRFTDTWTLARQCPSSLQRAHLCIYLAAGLESGVLGFQV